MKQYYFLWVTLLLTTLSWGQITIESDGLNNSTTLFTLTNGAYYTGNSGTGDSPASSPFASEGTHSRGISSGTATLLSNDINTTGYNTIELKISLASFSVNSNGNGADAADYVRVEISPNGGTNYYSTLQVNGNTNARWAYSTTPATTPYDGDATATLFTPTAGGLRTTDGYSAIKITNLPSVTNLKFRITLLNNDPNERWLVDDFILTGLSNASPTILVTPINLNGFIYVEGSGPSAEQTFTVSGLSLTNNITVTPPTNYEISLSSGSGFTSSPIVLTQTGGTVANTTFYARLKSALPIAYYNNEIINATSTGASTKTITCNGYVAPPPTTYSWNNAAGGDWTVSSNWTPTRTVAHTTDKLVFNNNATYTVTSVPTESVQQLSISNQTEVTLQAAASATLTISGDAGTDLELETQSSLNISGTNALVIAVNTGATGSISGTMTFGSGAHKLTAANANGITFNNSSSLTLATGFTGNVFGSTVANSVIFANGSTFIQGAGSNPFNLTAPSSVVVFQTGSLYKLTANLTPSVSGRTYANFEYDVPTITINTTGATALTLDNLTVTNGTLNLNLTGGINLKGNVNVASGASLGFLPTTANTISLNGLSAQSITNNGNLTFGTNANLEINNLAGVSLLNQLTFNKLTIKNGILDLGIFTPHTTDKLYIENLGWGVQDGTWGSTSSSATHKNDTYFAGIGFLSVTNSTLSIGQTEIANFAVYPNPVKGGKVFISSANPTAERSIQIVDVLGKVVLNQQSSQTAIDVSHLSKGVYIIKVAEEGKIATRKLVVE